MHNRKIIRQIFIITKLHHHMQDIILATKLLRIYNKYSEHDANSSKVLGAVHREHTHKMNNLLNAL